MTETQDLFGAAQVNKDALTRPLAVRMRPRTLEEVAGQRKALVQGSPLRRLALRCGALRVPRAQPP